METLAEMTVTVVPFSALLQVLLRVGHIAAAIALGGAVVYQWIALQPALRHIDAAQRAQLEARLCRRWAPVFVAAVAVLLLTGLLNFLVFKVPAYRGKPFVGLYHGLFGVKLLAAFALFHAAAVLSLPGPRFDRFRNRAGGWLTWALLLLAAIVVVGAILRFLPAFYD